MRQTYLPERYLPDAADEKERTKGIKITWHLHP